MRLVDADALAMKLRHMGYMDETEEVQEVIDRFAEEHDGDLICRQAAIAAMLQLQDEDIEAYGCKIPECFDSRRAIEALKELPSEEPPWNNHTVACLLAELFDDTCACNYCGIDEWLPEKCEVIDACPNPVGVACWEQFLTHRKENG